jgi:hypothetical protein
VGITTRFRKEAPQKRFSLFHNAHWPDYAAAASLRIRGRTDAV